MKDIDGREVEFRPLTREEQLEWQVGFLKQQLAEIKDLLERTELELLLVKSERLQILLDDKNLVKSK